MTKRPSPAVRPRPLTRFLLPATLALAMTAPFVSAQITWDNDQLINGPDPVSISSGTTVTVASENPDQEITISMGDGDETSGTLDVAGTLNLNPQNAAYNLYVGRNGGTGTLNITGGSITALYTGTGGYGRLHIGYGVDSTGTVNQVGGSVNLDRGSLAIGRDGGTGTYTLSGNATLAADGYVYVGRNGGNGELILEDTAQMTMTSDNDGWFNIGHDASGRGTVTQRGSSIVDVAIGGGIQLGVGASGAQGEYVLEGGTLTAQTGGAGFSIGTAAGATGSFTQSGGTAEFKGYSGTVGNVYVGNAGTGTFTVSGGTSTIRSRVILGNADGSEGTLIIGTEDDKVGVLEVGGTNGIQQGGGDATFQIAGGTLRVIDGDLTTSVAPELVAGTTSTIDTNGRNATFSNGFTGTGGFSKVGGGSWTIGGANTLESDSTVEGNLVISAPDTDTTPASLDIGTDGDPVTLTVRNVSGGGESAIIVGSGEDQSGKLNLGEGGTIILNGTTGANDIRVGYEGGHGVVNMTGGTIEADSSGGYGRIILGWGAGSTAEFNQSGGSIENDGSFYIGTSGVATYTMSNDATLNPGITAYIGHSGSGDGTLIIEDSANFTQSIGDVGLRVGHSGGSGLIHQKDNSVVHLTSGAFIMFGNGTGAEGTYLLEGGELVMKAALDSPTGVNFGVTAGSKGVFTQTGGNSTFQHNAVLVGNEGTGEFTVSGGTSRLEKGILLAEEEDSHGTLVIGAEDDKVGVLEVGGTNGIRQGDGNATFRIAGGTLRVINESETDQDLTTSIAPELVGGTTSTIDTNGRNATFSNGFTGTGGFSKVGGGSWTIGGANTLESDSTVEGNLVISAPDTDTTPASLDIGTDGDPVTLTIESLSSGGESELIVGQGTGQSGTLNLGAGGAIINDATTASNNIVVGDAGGSGVFNMDGGTISRTEESGKYGRIIVGRGADSTGEFNQSGGKVTNDGSFYVGRDGGEGTYTLSGSAELDPGITAYIGFNGGEGELIIEDSANLTQSRGDVGFRVGHNNSTGRVVQRGADSVVDLSVGGAKVFGNVGTSTGTYELEDGTLTMRGGEFGKTADATGRFVQTGGSSTFQNTQVIVGDAGTGEFTVSGGTSVLEKGILLAKEEGSNGTLTIEGSPLPFENSGTLEVGGTDGIRKGAGTAVVVLDGGTLKVSGSDLTSSVDMTLESDSGTPSKIDTNSLNASLSGILSGGGHLVKQGAGTLLLSGANDYTGTTTVTAGTLAIASGGRTGTGTVTIDLDATLTGTGLVQGFTQVHGKLNPGNSPGNLTFANGLELKDNDSNTTMEIAGLDADQYDTITITGGDLTLGGTLTLNITSFFMEETTFDLFNLSGEGDIFGDFEFIKLTGVYGSGDLTFDSFSNAWSLTLGDFNNGTIAFSTSGGQGQLTVDAVPEPGTWALLATAAGALWMMQRRRRQGVA